MNLKKKEWMNFERKKWMNFEKKGMNEFSCKNGTSKSYIVMRCKLVRMNKLFYSSFKMIRNNDATNF